MPHFEVHGGHVKRSRLLGDCFSKRSVSHRGTSRAYALHQKFLTTERTQRRFRSPAVKLPLLCPNTATMKLTEIVSLLGRNVGTVRHFGGGQLVNASSGLDASHVVNVCFPLCFHSASLSPCLISWSQQLSGPSSSLKWRRSSLVKSVGGLPVPTHPLQHAVYCSHWPHRIFHRHSHCSANHAPALQKSQAFALRCVSTVSDTGMKHSVRDRRGDL